MRADRLLSILLLLQVHRRLPARDLARRLEVSERTIHRDMEALCAAGVPIMAERGPGGGWSLPDGYETNLTGLNPGEVTSLFLNRSPRMLSDLGQDQAADAALTKLLAALPAAHRRDAEYARQRILVDAAGWHRSGESVTWLPVLQDAIWQERKLSMNYRKGDGTAAERLVAPLGLVAKGNVWYLVALSEGEPRTYRVSRVMEAHVTDEAFTRPVGFDLAAHWAQSAAEFVAALPRIPAVVRANPAILPRMRAAGRWSRIEQVDPPGADGWSTIHIRFEEEPDVIEYCLSFGPDLELLEPVGLRTKIKERAAATAAVYQ
jgi:predicted DNA-binding transcriptional regulator YafY